MVIQQFIGRRFHRAATLFPMLAGSLLLSCSEAPGPLNVVLVVVDTLRADTLGLYGAEARVSPHVDALARRGVTFRHCVSQAPWTIPAFGSILTGEFPSSHGADWLSNSLSEDVPVLTERLKKAGWTTAAFVSHQLVSKRYGFDRAFDTFDDTNAAGHEHVSSTILTDFACRWLDELEGDAPFFLLVHYFDPHYNYMAHEGYTTTTPYAGRFGPNEDIWTLRDSELGPEDLRYLRELYLGEIRYFDRQLGRLLRRLEEHGLDGNTVIALTADHGEEFLDHGWLGHTTNLYQGLLQVPLVFAGPGLQPGVRGDPAMLVDVHPTLSKLAGAGEARTAGRDLFTGPDEERLVVAEVEFAPRKAKAGEPKNAFEREKRRRRISKLAIQKSVQLDEWKAIRNDVTGTWELYDLSFDPGEKRDLSAERPEVLERLQGELGAWEENLVHAVGGEVQLSSEDLEQLRALGYTQ